MTTETSAELTDDTTTQTRLRAIQSGDREAFAALVEQHYSLMLRVALRVTGNQCDAEDVAQLLPTGGESPRHAAVVCPIKSRIAKRQRC